MGVSTVPSTGARGAVSIGEEIFFGMPVQPTHRLEFTSESLSETESPLTSAAIRPDRARGEQVKGSLDIGGDLSYEVAASGMGLLFRHALGDYVKFSNCEGGVHARQDRATAKVLAAVDTYGPFASMILAEDTIASFTTGLFSVVYKDANNILQYNDNAGAGFAYDSFNERMVTRITAVVASDITHSGGVTPAVAITLAPYIGPDGTLINPVLNADGGVLVYGQNRNETTYFESLDLGAGLGTQVWLNPADTAVASPILPVVGEIVIVMPCLTVDTAFAVAAVGLGYWVYEFEPNPGDYNGVWVHHIERGRRLPVGLTVEVDRDASVFVYAGMKVNQLVVNFETNAIVNATASLLGQFEYAMSPLMFDVIPGAATITIEDGTAFPDAGVITIGEETGMTYSAKTINPDGTCTLTMVDTNVANTTAIQRIHLKGENVDPRTSNISATPVEGLNKPLTVFEAAAYIDGAFEEVLSGSITLNNNLNPDKYMLGSRGRAQLVEQRAEVDATLSMEFDDGKNLIKFKKGTQFALEIRCVSEEEDSEILTTGVMSQAYFFLPYCRYTGTTPNIGDDSYIVHDMPIIATPDDRLRTTDYVIILVNGLEYDCSTAP